MSENQEEAHTNQSVHNEFNSSSLRYLSSARERKITTERRRRLLQQHPLLRNDVASLNEHGFVVLRNQFQTASLKNPSLLSSVLSESRSLLQSVPFGRNRFEGYKTKRSHNVLSKTRTFDKFILHPRCTNILDYYLNPNHLLSIIQLIEIFPGSPAQPLHFDSQSLYGIGRPRVDRPMSISFFWALDENYNHDNGATLLIPGSHLWDETRVPTDEEIEKQGVTFNLNPGDCICILGTLWHCGGRHNGKNKQSRIILTSQHCQPFIRPVEGIMLSVPFEMVSQLPPKLQTMIGYSVHFPFYGSVNGIHPLKYLKKYILNREVEGESGEREGKGNGKAQGKSDWKIKSKL